MRTAIVAACLALSCLQKEYDTSFVFDPDESLTDATRHWLDRYQAATGLDISIGEGGIPVIESEETEGDCGGTWYYIEDGLHNTLLVEIDISPREGCPLVLDAVGHELGHALGAVGHVKKTGSILESRIGVGTNPVIDSGAIELICEYAYCNKFESEE